MVSGMVMTGSDNEEKGEEKRRKGEEKGTRTFSREKRDADIFRGAARPGIRIITRFVTPIRRPPPPVS
jgi:hypothetical protein